MRPVQNLNGVLEMKRHLVLRLQSIGMSSPWNAYFFSGTGSTADLASSLPVRGKLPRPKQMLLMTADETSLKALDAGATAAGFSRASPESSSLGPRTNLTELLLLKNDRRSLFYKDQTS